MGESFAPRSADYLFRSTAILRGVQAGCKTIAELESATALPQSTVIRVASQLVEDNVLKARWIRNEVQLTMASRSAHDV